MQIYNKEATRVTPDKTHQRHVAYQKNSLKRTERLNQFLHGSSGHHHPPDNDQRESEASCGLSFMVDSILHIIVSRNNLSAQKNGFPFMMSNFYKKGRE